MWVLPTEYWCSHGGKLSECVSRAFIRPRRWHVYCPGKSEIRRRRCEYCLGDTDVHMGGNLAPKWPKHLCGPCADDLTRSELIWSRLTWSDSMWSDLIWSDLIWLGLIRYYHIWSDLIWTNLILSDLILPDLIGFDLVCILSDLLLSDLIWSDLTWFDLI